MPHFRLACTECPASYSADMTTLHCTKCNSVLDVAYTTDEVHNAQCNPSAMPIPTPLRNPADAISLGEGNTPTVNLRNLGNSLGISRLYAKLEAMNPTGSFKDRGTAVMMSVAKEMGVTQVVEDSSGNAGASVSAYAARAGIDAHIFAPASAPAAKLGQIAVYGATTHAIDGDRQAVTDAAVDFANSNSIVYASHNLSPYFTEGTKTFAYEVVEQFGDDLPQHIVLPVGNGSLLIGTHKGFTEIKVAGKISRIPTLHAVQAQAVMPLVAAFNGKPAPTTGATIAGGIAVANPPRLLQCVRALNDTGGAAVAVAEVDILRWQRQIAAQEGVFIEPTSSAAFAGVKALLDMGKIQSADSILVAATGFGLKDAMPPSDD
ncbi:MAG: threonine synthase [Chloroflexi bacterium]|nr:threonine synthase [Chloroflexota bacterium]